MFRRLRFLALYHRWVWLRLLIIPAISISFSLMVAVSAVEATDGMRGNRCVVQEDEHIEHDFYFWCWTLVVHGTIDGDMIGVASEVTVTQNATVAGDVWVLGGQATIRGQVGDDVRFAGADLDIEEPATFPNAATDVTALALSTEIADGVRVPGDFSMIGYQALIFGDLGGQIDFQGQSLDIHGAVGGHVEAIVGDSRQEISVRTIPFVPYSVRLRDYGLFVNDSARIQGDLNYEAAQQANIPRGTVDGSIRYTRILSSQDITSAPEARTFFSILRNYVIEVLRDFIPLAIVGVLVLQFVPALLTESGRRAREKLLPAVSWGLILSILFFPVALMSILISIVLVFLVTFVTLSSMTLIVSVLLTIMNMVLVFGFGFLLIYMGRAIACYLIGVMLIRWLRFYFAMRTHDPDDPPIYIPPIPAEYRWTLLALGTVVYSLIVNLPLPPPIPTLELMIEAAAAFSGLGALFMLGRDAWYRYELRQGGLRPRRQMHFESDAFLDREGSLGMDNLPEGFSGFED